MKIEVNARYRAYIGKSESWDLYPDLYAKKGENRKQWRNTFWSILIVGGFKRAGQIWYVGIKDEQEIEVNHSEHIYMPVHIFDDDGKSVDGMFILFEQLSDRKGRFSTRSYPLT